MLFLVNWVSDRVVPAEAEELGEDTVLEAVAVAAAAAAAVTVEVVDDANDVADDEADGEFFSWPDEDVDRQGLGFCPAMARASVMLLEIVMPWACCCCFSCSKLLAELDGENFSRELAVSDPLRPDFFATLANREQLLKEAEFLTFVVLLMLSGTVHVALNDADRCTGTPESSSPLPGPCCCCCCCCWCDCWDC